MADPTPPPGFVLQSPTSLSPPPGFVLQPQIPDPVPQKNPGKPRTAGDVATEAYLNLGPSARQYLTDTVQTFAHPLQTLQLLQDIAQGGLKRFYGDKPPAFINPDADTTAFDQTAQHYKDRWGGWENAKNTIATDPVGALGDVTVPLSVGGTLAARLPGVAGTAGRVLKAAGNLDPATAAFEGVNAALPAVAGFTTGAGPTSIREAQRVARDGTPQARADFKGNMRGTASPTDVLEDAKVNLQQIKTDRNAAYQTEMGRLGANNVTLQFAPIQQAWTLLKASFQTPSGLSKASASTRRTLDDIEAALAEWSASPADHNVMGFDALKQRIQDLYPEAEKAGQGQRAVATMTNAIKAAIEQQAPQYKSIMQAYESDSRQMREIERALSLGDEATVDTAMRKLQSVTRNNVQTNYSQRQNLVTELERRGGRELMPSLAGQSLNTWSPRGLAPQLNASAMGGWAAVMQPKALPFLVVNSPRAVGETTYAMNRMYSELAKVMGGATPGQASYQAGREQRQRSDLAAALSRPNG